MLTVHLNSFVSLQMDTERELPGIADGVAVFETTATRSKFQYPFHLIINSDDDIAVSPVDIRQGVETLLSEHGLEVRVASIRMATK